MVNWEFQIGDTPPDVRPGYMKCFVVIIRMDNGRQWVGPSYYLNEYPLEYEDCICGAEHEDGCPTTGWFEHVSNPDYDETFTRESGQIIGYAAIPDVDTALKLLTGGPW